MGIPGLNLLGSAFGIAMPAVGAALGIGKNTTNVQNFGTTSQYDPSKFEYGGRAGGADDAANRYRFGAEQAQTRVGEHVDYGNALGQRQNSLYARQGQEGIAGLMDARARGLVPSIAQMQADRQMQQAQAAQASAMASARGPAALALAQQNAANNVANAAGSISNQAQINAAQERLAAENAAFGAYSGMRAGDFQGQGADAQMAQYQAMLLQQQRAQNDQFSLGMTAQEQAVRQAQLAAGQNQQQMLAGSHTNTTNMELQRGQRNADREFDYYKQFTGSLQGGVDNATAHGLGGGGGGGGGGLQPPPAPVQGGSSQGGVMNSNLVGVPQPGPGSDDRMKMGLMPLDFGVGGPSPMSGPAPANFEGVGSNGMDPMGALAAHGAVGTQFVGDASGGMASGGLLSDDRAKLATAYNMGRAHQMEYATTGERPGGWEFPLPPDLTDQYVNTDKRDRDNGIRQPTSFTRDKREEPGWRQQWAATPYHRAIKDMIGDAAFGPVPAIAKAASSGPVSTDPVTAQFAQGAAPIQFQYKPGLGPPGERIGVRAQGMLTTPITAPAVTQRPDGYLAIDSQQGLGTALAGVGHLAQKQAVQDAELRALEEKLAQRGGYR